ncbi:MAG: alpha/beta hydrolase [Robiginitomaculum sp.]|nr:alpha/beta hydrolase [Robiginitomaculum sp.]MDQ7077738.1 alpha/beta hydrolase [Robiginitomaculum sp.]
MWLRKLGLVVLAIGAMIMAPAWADDAIPAKAVHFKAADGVTVYADEYLAKTGKSAPLVILFHQAGSNARGEYGPIIPRLTGLGLSVLAVDQRSGGSYFGAENRTVNALGHSTKYCDAYPDMEAALAYAIQNDFTGPRFAWGSSYSAALVLKLGGDHKNDLTAVLAFSPAAGGAMGACNANHYLDSVAVPVLALSPRSEMAGRQAQFARLKERGYQTFVAEDGVHGSSMLVKARTHADTSATWDTVIGFLELHGAEYK